MTFGDALLFLLAVPLRGQRANTFNQQVYCLCWRFFFLANQSGWNREGRAP